jgi:hypothetical protein
MRPQSLSSSLIRTLTILTVLTFAFLARAQEADAGKIFSQVQKSLVIIKGKGGSGSGAVIRIGKLNYVVTNAHVLSQNPGVVATGSNGKPIPTGDLGFAKGYDIARMETEADVPALSLMADVASGVRVGDEIMILGNSGGAGVFAPLSGKVTGIGPKLVEIDAEIVPGNSGSPIIHVKTGKVVGVVSHAIQRNVSSMLEANSSLPAVRKFGQRIDTVREWDDRTAAAFEAEWRQIMAVQKRTQDLIVIYKDFSDHDEPDEGIASRLSAPLNTSHLNFVRNIKSAALRSDATRFVNAYGQYFTFLEQSTRTDVNGIPRDGLITLHQDILAEEVNIRRELWKRYSSVLERIKTVRKRL